MFEFLVIIGLIGLWILNFVISFINAVGVGMAWTESSIIGGWQKLVTGAAAVMSMAGFTWCYLLIAVFIASTFNLLEPEYIDAMASLGYLIIIFPILGTGLAITIDSWAYTIRNKSFGGLAISSYNTVALTYNMFRALDAVPKALGNVIETLLGGNSSNSKGKGATRLLVIVIVIVVLVLGILTTIAIVKWIANKDRKKSVEKINEAYSS